MTNFTNRFVSRISLAIFFVALFANVVKAQFPVQKSNNMVGSWTVSNVEGYSIQILINSKNQFRMLVNGNASEGSIQSSNNNVTLNFTDGKQQKFKSSFNNGQLIFEAENGKQRFVMNRANAEKTVPDRVAGFPEGSSTETVADEVEEDVVDETPNQQLLGQWYAKMEDRQVEVFIKSDFRQDGTYTTSLLMVAGAEKETQKDTGKWMITNGKLITVSDGETAREIVPIQFMNENLVIDMSAEFGAKMVMSRNPEKVQATRFDLQKLIEYAQGQANGGW